MCVACDNRAMDEQKLIWQLRQGEVGAVRELYTHLKPKLKRWLLKQVGDERDVEELLHDTLLSLIDSLPIFRGESGLWTFALSIARHEVADYWRKKYAKKAIKTVPFMDQVYIERLYSKKKVSQAIEQAYMRINAESALIIRWKYEDNLSVEVIAAKLGLSVKAAESRLFRARKAFRLTYTALDK